MHRVMAFSVAFLTATASPADTTQQTVEGKGKPGLPVGGVVTVQGDPAGKPIPVTATVNVAGASDTVGNPATFNGNNVCATVLITGQPGAGFYLGAGTLAATLTPSISENATPASPGCTGGNYTPSKFIVDVNGNTAPTLVLTNPNAFQHVGIATLSGTRCVQVCTGSSGTTGSATGFLVATVAQSPPPAPSADVTDRPARQVGKVYGSDGFPLATANSGRAQVDIITGAGGTSDAAASAAASESATNRGATTSALRVLDTSQAAGSQLVTVQGTATNGARVDVKASVLPTGAATETTLAGVKAGTDKIPASPSQEHATAASPHAARLTDGTSFYKATTPADTQPISAASLPLPSGAATETTLGTRAADATLTGGTAKAIMRGGAKGTTTAADVTSTASGANHQPADVILYDAAGSALDPRTRSWTLSSGTDSVNVGNFPATYDTSDRAARLLGVVYGSQAQQLKQTATNFNLATELFAGGTAYDARSIRALTSSDVVDVSDRAARLLGHTVTDTGSVTDVSDRSARLLGHVVADSGSTTAVSSTVYPTALTFGATGQQAVTASAVALPSNAAKVVCLKVLDGGTQNVKFGISGVTTGTGQELVPGQGACRPASNSNVFFVIAGATGSTVAFETWQ